MLSVGDRFTYDFSFSTEDLNSFIALSGDSNIIHKNDEAARRSPIGKMAVPGLLTALIFSRVLGTMFPGHGTVYRSQTLEFIRPVLLDDPYVAKFEVKEAIPERHRAIIQTTIVEKANNKVCLDGVAKVINYQKL
jgi:acyl dehydratase